MFQVGFAHVEQALAGHGAVLHFVFFGHEGQHGIHQRTFTGSAAALDHHAQRFVQLARDSGQITHQLIRLFANQPASREVGEDAGCQVGRFQQGERGLLLGLFHLLLGRSLQGVADDGILQLFERQQHAAKVVF